VDYPSFVWSLHSIFHSDLNFVVASDGIVGVACIQIREGDLVCILEGTRNETPIILRKSPTIEAKAYYEVVGYIFLSEQNEEPISPSRKGDQIKT
jgi:hypothetical protein